MYGVPGMRSAVLPTVARLDVVRVRFLIRLWVNSRHSAEALFNGHGGELRSSKLNEVVFSLPRRRGRPSYLSLQRQNQNDFFPGEILVSEAQKNPLFFDLRRCSTADQSGLPDFKDS